MAAFAWLNRAADDCSLDFLPLAGRAQSVNSDRPTAVPDGWGMAALHSKYGKKTWRELLAPARNFSRDGFIQRRILRMIWRRWPDHCLPILHLVPFLAAAVENRIHRVAASVKSTFTPYSGKCGERRGRLYTGILATRLVEAVAAAGRSIRSS